jgi:archaellum component FlaC
MAKVRTRDLINLDDHELLVEMARSERAASRRQLISSIAVLVIACIAAVAVILIVPKAFSLFDDAQKLMSDVQGSVQKIDDLIEDTGDSMEKISTMLDEIAPTVEGLDKSMDGIDEMVSGINSLVATNSENLAEAIAKLNGIDIETLNKAIGDLATTVEPLANFFGAFNR